MAKSIKIEQDTKTRLEQLKGFTLEGQRASFNDTIEYLLGIHDLIAKEANGSIKAIIQVRKWLQFGHDAPITVTELRKWTGIRANACSKAIESMGNEVSEFNNQFK